MMITPHILPNDSDGGPTRCRAWSSRTWRRCPEQDEADAGPRPSRRTAVEHQRAGAVEGRLQEAAAGAPAEQEKQRLSVREPGAQRPREAGRPSGRAQKRQLPRSGRRPSRAARAEARGRSAPRRPKTKAADGRKDARREGQEQGGRRGRALPQPDAVALAEARARANALAAEAAPRADAVT
jgi:hypothetical protein